jgi:hypothetical protein
MHILITGQELIVITQTQLSTKPNIELKKKYASNKKEENG